jgi:formylglycine-generating enzyme required for sulfatase activity
MKLIKGGAFIMGESTNGFENEKPKRIEHTLDFYIQPYEITVKQYRKYLAQTNSNETPRYWPEQSSGNQLLPVQGITWNAADKYCNYFGGRLPTEKEWEYSARGEDGRTYVFGNDFTNDNSVNWYFDKKHRNISPVGSYLDDISSAGIFDLTGNVREWVDDVEDSYLLQEIPVDSNGIAFKVVRGGAFSTRSKKMLRPSYRAFKHPDTQITGVGFRCCKSPQESDIE